MKTILRPLSKQSVIYGTKHQTAPSLKPASSSKRDNPGRPAAGPESVFQSSAKVICQLHRFLQSHLNTAPEQLPAALCQKRPVGTDPAAGRQSFTLWLTPNGRSAKTAYPRMP